MINGGSTAILYCFVFLYFAASGPGPWAINQKVLAFHRLLPRPRSDSGGSRLAAASRMSASGLANAQARAETSSQVGGRMGVSKKQHERAMLSRRCTPPCSRPRSCCALMPRVCSPWRKGATIPRFIGSRRKNAASSRLTAFMSRDDWRAPMKSGRYEVTADRAFAEVMRGCAEPAEGANRPGSMTKSCGFIWRCMPAAMPIRWNAGRRANWWAGFTVFAWARPSLGRACSAAPAMPQRWLWCIWWKRLRQGGFILLDTQFLTPHLATFGAYEIPRDRLSCPAA